MWRSQGRTTPLHFQIVYARGGDAANQPQDKGKGTCYSTDNRKVCGVVGTCSVDGSGGPYSRAPGIRRMDPVLLGIDVVITTGLLKKS